MWRTGGIFDDMVINSAEFATQDVYQLKIFDTKPDLPQICKYTDPSLNYCQLTGDYLMELPGYNTVEPYSHMNEKCPTIGPNYVRPSGC